MRLLVDSHILLRLDTDPDLIPQAHRVLLEDLDNEVFLSTVTAWELGIKQSKGKLRLSRPVSEQRLLWGFLELTITFEHAEFATALPLLHKDPFDRMLVAQAFVEGLTLVTVDRRLAGYGVPIL